MFLRYVNNADTRIIFDNLHPKRYPEAELTTLKACAFRKIAVDYRHTRPIFDLQLTEELVPMEAFVRRCMVFYHNIAIDIIFSTNTSTGTNGG